MYQLVPNNSNFFLRSLRLLNVPIKKPGTSQGIIWTYQGIVSGII
jgi:hypothetical protein